VDERVRRFDELARDLLSRPSDGVRLVGVDGLGAAGKTTFASRLSRAAGGAPVVHTDDFASWEQPVEWWPRMLAEVVEPLSNGETATYTPYEWVRRSPAEQSITVTPDPLVVIEGVGATRLAWRDRLTARIWLDAARDTRLARGLERDGEHMREFWGWWMAAEDRYVAAEHPEAGANLVVDGEPTIAHDPETEFVEILRPSRSPGRNR
jgi:uridine kinase